MGIDAVRGRGAFRCGCGQRVAIIIPSAKATCIGGAPSGDACRIPPTANSQSVGVPLCLDHLKAYQRYLEVIEEGERWGELMKEAWEDSRRALESGQASRRTWEGEYLAARRRLYETQSVVYYVRIGDLIKIGVTVNMKARMPQVMPDEILATEPGGIELERQRQTQFAHLRVRGERFARGEDLLAHIAQIREAHGAPQMTGYLLADSRTRPFGDAL